MSDDTLIQKAITQIGGDLKPQSGQHVLRQVVAVALYAAAIYQFVIHRGDWTKNELIAMGGCAGLATVIAFTGTTFALLKLVMFWKKNGTTA